MRGDLVVTTTTVEKGAEAAAAGEGSTTTMTSPRARPRAETGKTAHLGGEAEAASTTISLDRLERIGADNIMMMRTAPLAEMIDPGNTMRVDAGAVLPGKSEETGATSGLGMTPKSSTEAEAAVADLMAEKIDILQGKIARSERIGAEAALPMATITTVLVDLEVDLVY